MTADRPRALVVEDNAALRLCIADILDECGFNVIETVTADAAALLLIEDASRFQVVFTDIRTPGRLDGVALALRIADEWPHIRVIVTSGVSDERRPVLPIGVRFLAKPWHVQQLVALMDEIAQEARPSA